MWYAKSTTFVRKLVPLFDKLSATMPVTVLKTVQAHALDKDANIRSDCRDITEEHFSTWSEKTASSSTDHRGE